MANELVINHPTGSTLYALLFDGTGQIYNGATFGAPGSASWTDYDIAMTEAETATGIYRASMPAVAAGTYGWVVRKQAGASPAVADIAIGSGTIRWTGTAEEAVPAAVNVTYSAGVALTGRLAEVTDLPAAAPTAAAVADAVWDEEISGHLTAGTTGAKLNTAASASGAGSTAYTNTVTDSTSAPLDGVEVWITSDSGGASTVASTTTDTLGAFTVWLDPGTYYLWLAKGGYNFGNPTTITVS